VKIRRNSIAGDDSAVGAQQLSDARRRSAAKHSVSPDTVFYVETGLCWKWSPEQISAICKRIGSPVSHGWIYQSIQSYKPIRGELYKHLRQGKRRYRKGNGTKRGRIPDAVSIEQRPAVVDERSRLGDWEADLVLGAQGTGAIVTLAERKSRIYLTKKVFSKEAKEVSRAVIAKLHSYKDFCHTLTFDNGGGLSEHRAIAEVLEAKTYFAHPYASH
jgi:IS30 family transposase